MNQHRELGVREKVLIRHIRIERNPHRVDLDRRARALQLQGQFEIDILQRVELHLECAANQVEANCYAKIILDKGGNGVV